MSDPPSYDQDLLSRLNALKKSSISLDASKPTPLLSSSSREATPETTLSERLKSLRNNSTSSSPSPSLHPKPQLSSQSRVTIEEIGSDPLRNPKSLEINEKTLDELLSDLGGEEQWDLKPEDPDEVRKMLAEAKHTLQDQSTSLSRKLVAKSADEAWKVEQVADRKDRGGKGRKGEEILTGDLDMSVFAYDENLDEEDGDVDEDMTENMERKGVKGNQIDEEAEEIMRRMLDEVSLEKEHEPERLPGDDGKEGEGDSLSLPSVPTKHLERASTPDLEPDDFEKSIAARMAALNNTSTTNSLGLPSVPTFRPTDKPVKGVQKKITDEEIDSWCIICNDDATVQCMGCSGDLYCANCWKEGHMGPDVGFEEKSHKWRKYIKPR